MFILPELTVINKPRANDTEVRFFIYYSLNSDKYLSLKKTFIMIN
jgi:hypothetical protein